MKAIFEIRSDMYIIYYMKIVPTPLSIRHIRSY